jgi:hypothetical protein
MFFELSAAGLRGLTGAFLSRSTSANVLTSVVCFMERARGTLSKSLRFSNRFTGCVMSISLGGGHLEVDDNALGDRCARHTATTIFIFVSGRSETR